ncbi:MAG: hypothetical protein JNM40_04055 [Myxococcales bacterium]|nr:hypothetical protein [Myxococcales bacterium]
MAMKTLMDTKYFRVEHDPARKLVIMRRTAQGLSVKTLEEERSRDVAIRDLLSVLRAVRGQRFLLDVRAAPGNNDPAVEVVVQKLRLQLRELFTVSVTVVASATGVLQVNRLARERNESMTIFRDEQEAIASLMERALP